MTLVSKSFSEIVTFSRSSNATRVGPTGLVEYAPHNLLVRSQEFDNASWTKGNATVTANAIAAPDGTITAETIVNNSTSGEHRIYQGVTSNVGDTYSIYAKAGTASFVALTGSGLSAESAIFNLGDGSVAYVNTGSASITSVGNGWYRCSYYSTAVNRSFIIINFGSSQAQATPGNSYVGSGEYLYLWGAQLSVGPYALDYTPTTSAAVYGPRFDYDPVTLAARGLLVEESRTNLLTYSEDFSNAAWAKTNSTITANNATSPDGAVTADLISGSGVGQRIVQGITANGTQQTLSFFVKKPSSGVFSGASLLFYNNTTAATIAYATFSGQTFTANATTGTATSTSYGNGWYRITLTNSSGLSVGNSVGCYLYPDDQGGGSSASDTLLAWGAQCE